jgi:2-polyprenyl-3-methyl-5-hydroxy-6-metoxy-1,4-benzoquinol methylase
MSKERGMQSVQKFAEIPAPGMTVAGSVPHRCAGCADEGCKLLLDVPGEPREIQKTFTYAYCEVCKTLTHTEPNFDASPYYQGRYYSHSLKKENVVKTAALRVRNAATAFAPSWLSEAVCAISEHPVLPRLRPILRGDFGRAITAKHRWIDIGCGAGSLLRDMRGIGFTDLTGADPFMREERHERGFRLLRSDGVSLNQVFDVVMMHHSLEHVPHPEETLEALHRILSPSGVMLIRIPLCGSELWRRHGGAWANLDAPRHVTLWSAKGFVQAAERTGWKTRSVVFDAMARSIYAGEARIRFHVHEMNQDVRRYFTKAQHKGFEREVRELNRQGVADAAAFYLTH